MDKNQILTLLGKTFKGTLIQDPILDPYFIVRYAEGGFGVMKCRTDQKGNLKFRAIGYPTNFLSGLNMIAQEQLHGEGQSYDSIQKYISNWNEISSRILNAYKDWNVNKI